MMGMDPAVDIAVVPAPPPPPPPPPPVLKPEGEVVAVGEKRDLENGEEEVRPAKKLKNVEEEMQRVAEIVMVLSAMAAMRSGKQGEGKIPTEVEVKLMAEARAKLVEICQGFSPKDLVGKDAIGTVIEDLGLNWKAKDPRSGFRPSRMSIIEKFSLSKRKLEEAKIFAATSMAYNNSTPAPQVAQMGFGQTHTMRMINSTDRPSNAALHSGGSPAVAASASLHPGNISSVTAASAPMMNQMQNAEVRGGLASGQIGRESTVTAAAGLGLNRSGKAQTKVEGGPNVSYAPQLQAHASVNHLLVNTPTWSIHPHSTSSGKPILENKVPNHNPVKVDGTSEMGGVHQTSSQLARDQTFRPFVTQNSPANLPTVHPSMQGMKYVQPAPFFTSHNEIVKIVQKLLQPKLPEHPTWTPPSREYMNKAVPCQMCKHAVNEVETVVLCDACEKGYHLKCLEAISQKGIPRGEWHCPRCTALSNGKPLPPKYGRVMRSMTPPKGSSNSAGAQLSSEKKVGSKDSKVSQEKFSASGSSALQNADRFIPAGMNNAESALHSKIPNDVQILGHTTSSGKDADQGVSAGTLSSNSMEISTEKTQVPKSTTEEPSASESSSQRPTVASENVDKKDENCKAPLMSQELIQKELPNSSELPLKTSLGDSIIDKSESVRETNDSTLQLDNEDSEQHVHQNSVGSSEPDNGAGERADSSSNGLQSVEWIGDALKTVDDKTFYGSCCVGGVAYKVQDHALFRSSLDKVVPYKLQDMWEDVKTGIKWILVNQCYSPSDLPEAVGHPCAPESMEVYESNHESSAMAGLIQGPCEVLPSTKFKEKSEKQSQLGPEEKERSRPLFLCKWFYDEVKGNFQPVFG